VGTTNDSTTARAVRLFMGSGIVPLQSLCLHAPKPDCHTEHELQF
jgi:hypothetical protein